jgi:hypothetical protein
MMVSEPNIEKIVGFMGKLQNTKSNEDAESLRKEMDEFMNNELGVNINEINEQIDNMASSMKEAENINKEDSPKEQ